MTADLCFTVTNDQPLFLSDLGEPEPGFYDSLAGKPRWALAAAGMGCRLRKVCWPSAGWRPDDPGPAQPAVLNA